MTSHHRPSASWQDACSCARRCPSGRIPSIADVKRYVAAEPAAVSYIPEADVDASVKVVYRLR